MTLIDLCLHDGVKLRYPTYGKKCTTSAECKIYPDRRVRDIGRVMIWFEQLDGLG
jgi:hypothetical protein